MSDRMPVDQAIDLLKSFVKESAIPGQTHLCKSLLPPEQHDLFDRAIGAVYFAISQGELTQEDFNHRVGLTN